MASKVTFRVETGEWAGTVITVSLNKPCGARADWDASELLRKLDFCQEHLKNKDYNGSFARAVSIEKVKE